MSKAFVTKPAPAFDAEALLANGEFGNIKLSDYAGKYGASRAHATRTQTDEWMDGRMDGPRTNT